ncbi:MAG TPA: ferritin-like domain-containing protein [Gammaproteobacteria bacterium]|nr:ferritin-like domain-containing protein [Gammaproteobacteria bacterium]
MDADQGSVAAADHAMRHWSAPQSGTIAIGTQAHKELFCRMLLETHNPYKPAVIQWPALSAQALQRVTSLPVWDIAVQTEGRASVRVRAFAETVDEALLREALDMDAAEEARHKEVLSTMVAAYGIELAPEPRYAPPKDPEWAWLVTGYSECIDSFFAFGLFELAERSGFFPAELVDTFEPVMQEEARHILFFVNWAAWYRRNLPWWRRPGFLLKTLRVWAFLVWERIGIARGLDEQGDMQDANFAVTGSQQVGGDVRVRELLELCLTENERRMAGYDERLLRPSVVPFFVRVARRFMPR